VDAPGKTAKDFAGHDYEISVKKQIMTSDAENGGISLFTVYVNHDLDYDWASEQDCWYDASTEIYHTQNPVDGEEDGVDADYLAADFDKLNDAGKVFECEVSRIIKRYCKNECALHHEDGDMQEVWVEKVPAPGHDWSKWTVYQAADETQTTRYQRTCSICKKHEVVAFSEAPKDPCKPGQHEYVDDPTFDWSKYTCGDTVEVPQICIKCNDTSAAPRKVTLEHDWDKEVLKEATCKDAGRILKTCLRCGEEKVEATAKLTTHTWDDGVVTKEATPSEAGEKLYTCQVCGATKTESYTFKPTKATTYTLKDLAYDSPIVKGVAVFDEYSIPVEKAYYRVTFFMADGSFIIAADAIGADGSFSTLCDAEVVHISVEIVDKKDCLLPETFKVYGAAAAYDAAE
jgi:hypothetical protein